MSDGTEDRALRRRVDAHYVRIEGVVGRLRELEAGLLGLKDQVEKMGARYAGIRSHSTLSDRIDMRAQEAAALKEEVAGLADAAGRDRLRIAGAEDAITGLQRAFSEHRHPTLMQTMREHSERLEEVEQRLHDADPPLSGCRETAWVAMRADGRGWMEAFSVLGFIPAKRGNSPALFATKYDAEMLINLLRIGASPAHVYTDTMEEVNP